MTTRERILQVAGDFFYRQGFRAVGVDKIVRETDVAKMTLYRYFPSKDDLIVAYLESANGNFWKWFEGAAATRPGDPQGQVLAVFEALEKLVHTPACHGCPFIVAASEFPEAETPGHRVALAHKLSVRARFRAMARKAGAAHPTLLADRLLLLMDGAFSAVRMFGLDNPDQRAAGAAAALLTADLGEGD
jgi:AcrR family transcriptional regulator